MNTAAKVHSETGSHWYYPDGKPCYEVPYSDPAKGMRPTTLRDAKKLGLLPSVTTILRILDKPALTAWKQEQAALAVLTSPRASGEEIDAFVKRVLQTDREQDEEASKARELGSEIHDCLEKALNGNGGNKLMEFWSEAFIAVQGLGRVISTEQIITASGYAGKMDALVENDEMITVLDFKTCKNLPKESYPEARLQLSAYAAALAFTGNKRIQTCNIYISTTEPGKIISFIHNDWSETFLNGFTPLMQVWKWLNNYNL